jgi:hypothetical protein
MASVESKLGSGLEKFREDSGKLPEATWPSKADAGEGFFYESALRFACRAYPEIFLPVIAGPTVAEFVQVLSRLRPTPCQFMRPESDSMYVVVAIRLGDGAGEPVRSFSGFARKAVHGPELGHIGKGQRIVGTDAACSRDVRGPEITVPGEELCVCERIVPVREVGI